MHIKTVVLIFILFSLSGCLKKTTGPLMPKPPALGAEFSAFTPPSVTEKNDLPIPPPEPNDLVSPDGIITLRQALALALMENPALKSYSWQLRSAQAQKLQASLKPNPEFSVDIEDFGGTKTLRRFKGYESTYLFSQLIETGGKRQKRYTVASLDKKIADCQYQAKRLEVFADVMAAFTDVLSAQQRLKLDGELFRLSEDIIQTVSDRVRAGKDPPLDEKKAKIVLANISILYRQAQNELDFAKTRLASLWASTPKFKKASGKLAMPKRIPSLEDISSYISGNPELAAAAAEIDRARADIQLQKALSKQDITVSGGIKRVEQNDSDAFIVGFSVPLGLTNRNQGNRRKAAYQLARARQQQRQIRSTLQTELAENFKEMANAYSAAAEYTERIIPAAKAVFEASKTSYTEGKLNYLDMLNSQKTLFVSLSEQVETIRDYHKSKANIEKIIARPIEPPATKQASP